MVVLDDDTEVLEPNIAILLKEVIVVPVNDVALMVPFTSRVYNGFDVFIPTFELKMKTFELLLDHCPPLVKSEPALYKFPLKLTSPLTSTVYVGVVFRTPILFDVTVRVGS